MNVIKIIALAFLLCVLQDELLAQVTSSTNSNETNKKSIWKGFDRYDFDLGKRGVRLITPAKPLSGNPWLWRARFPDWHYK